MLIMVSPRWSLRLYAFGLSRLHDPGWTGADLYDYLKGYMRGRGEPKGVFSRTLQQGVLWLLGKHLYDEFLEPERVQLDVSEKAITAEQLYWHAEDAAEFIATLPGCHRPTIDALEAILDDISTRYDQDETGYYEYLDRIGARKLTSAYRAMVEASEQPLTSARDEYAVAFAERVFHDRELCAFLAQLILAIGIDGGLDEGESARQWVDRRAWPAWALAALRARERGKCAECGRDIVIELSAEGNIDHIVPLSRGGTNDLVNLQLLCAECNNKKRDDLVDVRSSIPRYIAAALRRSDTA